MLKVLTHSAIRFEDNDLVYYVDPFNTKDYEHDADIIFVTHEHYDHFSKSDIDRLKKEDTVIVMPESMKLQAFDYDKVFFVNPDGLYKVKGLKFKTVKAYNTQKAFHPIENKWVGYLFATEEGVVYVAGDTDENEDNLKVKCDIALIPVGGTYTMDPMQAVHFINSIKPKKAIPTHYGSAVGDKNCGEIFAKHVDPEIEVEIQL